MEIHLYSETQIIEYFLNIFVAKNKHNNFILIFLEGVFFLKNQVLLKLSRYLPLVLVVFKTFFPRLPEVCISTHFFILMCWKISFINNTTYRETYRKIFLNYF